MILADLQLDQLSVIADQQAWGWLTHSLSSALLASHKIDVHCIPLWCIPVNCIPVQCIPLHWGCESVRGHYLPSLIHAISCSLGSKNGNALYLVSTVGDIPGSVVQCGCAEDPLGEGAGQIILINCGTEQRWLPWAPGFQYTHIRTSISRLPWLCTLYRFTFTNINIVFVCHQRSVCVCFNFDKTLDKLLAASPQNVTVSN